MTDINSKIKERMQQLSQEQGADQGGQQEVQTPTKTETPPEVKPTETKPADAQTQKVELGDSDILSFLREKKGLEVQSLDDLLKKPEPFQFASPEVEAINSYVAETNRGLNDYLNINKDRSELSDLDVAREFYLQKNSSLKEDDFNSLFDIDLKPLDPEEHDQATVDATDRAIRKRDAQLKLMASEGREYFDALQSKLKEPLERVNEQQKLAEQGAQVWEQNVASVAKEFDLGVEGYDFRTTPEELASRYSSPTKILDVFKNNEGQVDYAKMMQTIERGLAFDEISKVLTQKSADQATETVVKELENPSGERKNNQIEMTDVEMERMKQKMKDYFSQPRR